MLLFIYLCVFTLVRNSYISAWPLLCQSRNTSPLPTTTLFIGPSTPIILPQNNITKSTATKTNASRVWFNETSAYTVSTTASPSTAAVVVEVEVEVEVAAVAATSTETTQTFTATSF